jgi:hypothetical protein
MTVTFDAPFPPFDAPGMATRIRPPEITERFNAEIARIEATFLARNSTSVPPVLDLRPPLPSPLPTEDQQVNFAGWSYRCYVPGIYHAWPVAPDFRDRILRPWMALLDRASGQMIQSLHERAGALVTGSFFCVGRIGDAYARCTFPDAITVPMWFGPSPEDYEFVPIVSLAARRPLTAFLIEMFRAHGMNGRLTDFEYWTIAGEPLLPEREVTRNHLPGWVDRIGAIRTVTDGTDGVILFLESGWIPAPKHPTFTVTPEMIEPAISWPAALKRENLLGTATTA